eukprot:scpid107527/ scgid1963/ 
METKEDHRVEPVKQLRLQVVQRRADFKKYLTKILKSLSTKRKKQNTTTATKKWLSVLTDFCRKKKVTCDLATVSPTDLAGILKHAYVEIRTKNEKKDVQQGKPHF